MSETRTTSRTIVLTWTEQEAEVYGPEARVDLGERRATRTTTVAKAALWLAAGTDSDIAKARAYASTQGPEYRVFDYPTSERGWKRRAECDALRTASMPECSICRGRHGLEIIHACE